VEVLNQHIQHARTHARMHSHMRTYDIHSRMHSHMRTHAQMGGWWSRPFPLREADSTAPVSHGIYEIGYYRSGVFNPMYIGRASGDEVSIRSRLLDHYSFRGSGHVANYLKTHERDNLYARYVELTLVTLFWSILALGHTVLPRVQSAPFSEKTV